jgi:phosphoribosylformylglycinamidine cyclo-ligase
MADRYREAGVDIEAGEEAVRRIVAAVGSTRVPGAIGSLGGFGGLFDLGAAGVPSDSLLVSGTDGVGTKLKLAFMTDVHDTIGIDCVAMCVNDILVLGARPLFFLDYLAVGKLFPSVVEAIVSGVAAGCRQARCALIGGETAELPGFYADGEYDLAGFAVGAVARDRLVDGSAIVPGDVIVAIRSDGLHSNGFSLVRRVLLEEGGLGLDDIVEPLTTPLGEALLRPTRIYVGDLLPLLELEVPIHGMVHVTGGGLLGNVPRVLPEGTNAIFDQDKLDRLLRPEFELIRRVGKIAMREMHEVFNMGAGYLIIAPQSAVAAILDSIGERALRVGEIGELSDGRARVEIPSVAG